MTGPVGDGSVVRCDFGGGAICHNIPFRKGSHGRRSLNTFGGGATCRTYDFKRKRHFIGLSKIACDPGSSAMHAKTETPIPGELPLYTRDYGIRRRRKAAHWERTRARPEHGVYRLRAPGGGVAPAPHNCVPDKWGA